MMNIEEKLENAVKRSFLQIFVISIFLGLISYTFIFFLGTTNGLSAQTIVEHILVFFCGTVFFSCASFLAICAFLVPYLLQNTLQGRLAARAKKSLQDKADLDKKEAVPENYASEVKDENYAVVEEQKPASVEQASAASPIPPAAQQEAAPPDDK